MVFALEAPGKAYNLFLMELGLLSVCEQDPTNREMNSQYIFKVVFFFPPLAVLSDF